MQKRINKLANGLCLFCCYTWFADQTLSLVQTLKYLCIAIEKGYVTDDGFVLNPEGILELICKKKYRVTRSEANPKKLCIAEFHNTRTGLVHFVVVDRNDTIIYDPLEESITVKEGKIRSYRVLSKNNGV